MNRLSGVIFMIMVSLAMVNCANEVLPVVEVSGAVALDTPIPVTIPISQVTVTPIDTPTPEIQDRIIFPFGYGLEFSDPEWTTGIYAPVSKPGTGVITGKVILVDGPSDTPILVYKPALLQSDPKLPSQFVGWVESFYGSDRDPCDSTHVRENDASGWVIASSGEQWMLESDSILDSAAGFNINFAPDICVIVPGHAVFKFENVDATGSRDIELPTLNLPRHGGESAGWVVYPAEG